MRDSIYVFPCSSISFPQEIPFLAAPCISRNIITSVEAPIQLHHIPTSSSPSFLAHNMVQRKASNKIAGCPTGPMNRGGGAGGDYMKMPRKRRPNYMRSTRSSDARREKPQVTTIHSPTSVNCKPRNHAKPSSSSPLRPINKAIMATCSSILKNSKFPKTLELQPGGTEAQGTSAMRVCPYSYCSLNGHWHQPLPPLKSFILAKRKLLNIQKSFKLKGLPLFKVKGPVKDEEEIINDFLLGSSAKVEEFQDLQLQSFGERNTQNELNDTDEYYSDMGDDLDEKSDLLIEEFDSMLSLLEYVEFDEAIEAGEEVKEGREPTGMPTLNATSINRVKEEVSITNHKSNSADYPDDFLGSITLSSSETETIAGDLSIEPSSVLYEMADADAEQLIKLVRLETKQNFFNDGTEGEDVYDEVIEEPVINHDVHNQSEEKNKDISRVSSSTKIHEEVGDVDGSIGRYTKQDSPEIYEDPQTEDNNNYDTDDVYILTAYGSSEDEAKNNATTNTNQPLAETADVAKARMRITRKRTSEETKQMNEFNPRSPRFLEIEPELEAEKVDLRHQTTDERKSTEEWMMDYALRRAISKLDPARKRKVDLLVKAFETVIPPSTGREPLFYASSSFPHSTIIQPCN